MPTRVFTANQLWPDPPTFSIVWSGLLNTDDGAAWEWNRGAAERSVTVSGTFGAGGTLVMEGSANGATWTSIGTIQSAGGLGLYSDWRYIRPRVTAGDGTTNLVVTMHQAGVRQVPAEAVAAPANRRVIKIGDSRVQRGDTVAPHATGQKTYATDPLLWGMWLAGGRRCYSTPDLNFGVSGETTAQVLARAGDWLAPDAATALIFVGTNDSQGNSPLIADTLANIAIMRDLLLARGKRVIIVADTPRGDTTFTAARVANLNRHILLRNTLLGWSDFAPGRLYIADPWQFMASSAATLGDAIVGKLHDGVHLSPWGARDVGRPLAPILQHIFSPVDILPATNSDVFNATTNPTGCLNANPMMDGTGGTAGAGTTGSIATSWTIAASAGMTIVASKVTGSDGKVWQQIAWSGTPSGNTIGLMSLNIAANVSLGDTLEAVGEWELDAGATNLGGIGVGIRSVINSVAVLNQEGVREGGVFGPEAVGPVVSMCPRQVLSPVSVSGTTLRLDIEPWSVGVASAGTLRVRALAARKVF